VIIDVHGHYTTAPKGLGAYRSTSSNTKTNLPKRTLEVPDDEIRETIEHGQLKMQRDRGQTSPSSRPPPGGWRITWATRDQSLLDGRPSRADLPRLHDVS